MKYVIKPLIVDSVKYTGSNLSEIRKFCSKEMDDGSIQENCLVEQNQLYVINRGYVTPVMINEHIVKDITFGLTVYSPELFNYSFEPANHNEEVVKAYEKKMTEAPFNKDRFEHKVNSPIDVNYMQGKYIVFKQQSFSICFYTEQIEQLKKIVDKIYDTIEDQKHELPEEPKNDLISQSQVNLPVAHGKNNSEVSVKVSTAKAKKSKTK